MQPNPELGALRKIKWEKLKIFLKNGVFRQKLMGSFKPFCWGPKRTLNLEFCFVKKEYKKIEKNVTEKSIQKANPVGYRMHPNSQLGALRKVKAEKIDNFPSKWHFSPKIDGLL